MSNTFFTSDTHFGHKNILRLCSRPWESIDEHDRALIDAWNSRVHQEDLIFFLGDFAFTSPARAGRILSELHGYKYLVRGNHDSRRMTMLLGWSGHIEEGTTVGIEDGYFAVLSHKPPRGALTPGRIYLHGHSHGKKPRTREHLYDVGVDANSFAPVLSTEILASMSEEL